MSCIVSLCVVVYFDASSFFQVTGHRSRIVEIGRQKSVNWWEGSGEKGEWGAWDTKCGAPGKTRFARVVV